MEYAYTTGDVGTTTDTVIYQYGDSSWKDLLTQYDGKTILYDEVGNPLSDGTWTYSWEHGRQLSSMTNGSTTWNYTYDANGLRKSRSNGSAHYEYIYDGNRLSQMNIGEDVQYVFIYDADGPMALRVYSGSAITTYYYVTNLQGDVVAILNQAGKAVVKYTYDAWGNVISIEGDYKAGLGLRDPLLYRGYVYDRETKLYYLNSRYYDPAVGRFINADVYPSTGQGLIGNNMFAYCGNNPVNRVDVDGKAWETVFDFISLGASVLEVFANPSDLWAWAGLAGDVVDVVVPFVGGIGESVDALKGVVGVVEGTDDVVDAAKAVKQIVSNATGSYEIIYESGKNYIGKGPINRAITSALEHAKPNKLNNMMGDNVKSITWKSAPNSTQAFIDEYLWQKARGGVLSADKNLNTYNKIWSPGRNYIK